MQMLKLAPRAAAPRKDSLLISVTSERHSYTLAAVASALAKRGVRHERWSYAQLFSQRHLPRAAYIFTDFDRLHVWHIELAGKLYRRLTVRGLTVLNDPRRFVPRTALLKRLFRAGINAFTCWLPADGELPDRYPVFLRTIHAHRGVESSLLQNEAEAVNALHRALAKGKVISDLAFIEYAAEPSSPSGKFRKHACYGINGRMIRALTVTEDGWVAKMGTLGAASAGDYAADLTEQKTYPREALMARVFELAEVNFGRVDYGFFQGRPQIYELNTNPHISWIESHPNRDRIKADRLIRDEILSTLCALPYPDPGPPIDVAGLVPSDPAHPATFGQP